MKHLNYLFDNVSEDMYKLFMIGKTEGEVDVFIEHDCFEYILGGSSYCLTSSQQEDINCAGDVSAKENRVEECGYDGGTEGGHISERENEEYSDDSDDEDVDRPREDEEVEESEDETLKDETVCGEGGETVAGEGGDIVVDEGDDVVADAGNGGNDNRFKSLFEEGKKTVQDKKKAHCNDLEENAAAQREAEESEEEFGLGDVEYPDTPLESNEEWEQWTTHTRTKGKVKFHGDLDKEPYIWLFQKFNSGLEFKDQLLRYALKTQYDVKMSKSEENRIAITCCEDECPFRVYCSYEVPMNRWMVKICHMEHTHRKSSRVSMLKQGVIAGLFREELRRNIGYKQPRSKTRSKQGKTLLYQFPSATEEEELLQTTSLKLRQLNLVSCGSMRVNYEEHILVSTLRFAQLM